MIQMAPPGIPNYDDVPGQRARNALPFAGSSGTEEKTKAERPPFQTRRDNESRSHALLNALVDFLQSPLWRMPAHPVRFRG